MKKYVKSFSPIFIYIYNVIWTAVIRLVYAVRWKDRRIILGMRSLHALCRNNAWVRYLNCSDITKQLK
jgi:hypothetical protein